MPDPKSTLATALRRLDLHDAIPLRDWADDLVAALHDAGYVITPEADGSESRVDALVAALRAVTHEWVHPPIGWAVDARAPSCAAEEFPGGGMARFCRKPADHPVHATPERVLGAPERALGGTEAGERAGEGSDVSGPQNHAERHPYQSGGKWANECVCGEHMLAAVHRGLVVDDDPPAVREWLEAPQVPWAGLEARVAALEAWRDQMTDDGR